MLRRMSAVIVLGVSATVAQAGGIAAPPVHHTTQWWTSSAGCEYSRSGRPGGAVTWIVTKVPRGAVCPQYIGAGSR